MLLCWGESLEGLCIQMCTFVFLCMLDERVFSGGWHLPRAFFCVKEGFWGEEEFQRLLAVLNFAEMAAVIILQCCH